MKHLHFFVVLCVSIFQTTTAQTGEDVVRDLIQFKNPEWFQSPAQPEKKKYKPNSFDSVLIEYVNKVDRKKILIQTVQYTGEFRDGLFHGKGKLLLKQYSYPFTKDRPGIFSYEGDFENGAASGKGFVYNSWWYTPRRMNPVLVKMNCQAEFKNGLLTGGLVRYDHILNDVIILTCHYSGELHLKNWNPMLHGLGIVYISKANPESEVAKRSPGIAEGFYAGNFFYEEYTGFAICNYLNAADKGLSNLQVGIVGKGELLHTFSTLPVQQDWTYREPTAAQNNSAGFSKLFSDFKEVKKGVIYIDKENKYTGGIKNDMPHGIGYIENGNGFCDIAFWSNGKRLSVKEVLSHLLPDSAMIAMKRIEKKITREYTSTKGKRKKDEILKADYYGKLNANGNPEGWGILLRKTDFDPNYPDSYDSTKYEIDGTVVGNFKGIGAFDDYNNNDMRHLLKEEDKNNGFVIGLRENDIFRSYVFIPSYRKLGNNLPRVTEYYSYATPTIGAIETESFIDDMDDYQQLKQATTNYISSRKHIGVKKVTLSSGSGNSYVETYTGEKIYIQELTADQVQYGDFILYKDVFYEVNRALMLNDYIGPNEAHKHLSVTDAFNKQKGYVLKGYWMSAAYEPDPDNICAFCNGKPPGKSTYTGVGYTGRYETNVYSNNSGGINIVTTPITTVTSVTVDNKPCKYCKGIEARRRVKANVVRN